MDHSEKIYRRVHPREKANIFSLIFFVYTGGLFARGFKKDLEDDDLYEVVGKCRSKQSADRMENELNLYKIKHPKKKVSLMKILWNLYGLRYVALGLFHMTGRILITALEPEALSNLVGYFKPGQTKTTLSDACYFAAMMIGVKGFHTLYFQNYVVCLNELAVQMRVSFCSVIYRKALKLTPKALEDTSLGNIVTVITKDVQSFENTLSLFNDVWISIIQTVFVCYLIYNRVGVSSLVGVIILVSVIPVQGYISRVIRNLRLKMAENTDERLQRMQEAISTIKIIKMYTWENIFAEKIGESRLKEMKSMVKAAYLKIILMVTSTLVGKFAFYVIITIYLSLYKDMSAEDIFYIMKTFNILNHTIAMAFSRGFSKLGELTASLKRIDHILQLEELPAYIDKPDDNPQIELRNVSLKFKDKQILKDANLKVGVGLTVITGSLGCGKSSLIKVILRDCPVDDGEINTKGLKSYASQDSWLFPSSIRQNILFGEKFDPKRYHEVVRACALEYDFNILEKGDETIVADRGMNLSKGQQARINLARCVYKKSDIYLIDDALTALDSKVQEHIFTHCIQGFLKGKCIVLVTHNAKHIKQADSLVIIKDGVVNTEGKDRIRSDKLLESFETFEEIENNKDFDKGYKDTEYQLKKVDEAMVREKIDEESKKLIEVKSTTRRRQVYHENKKSGSVDSGLYLQYIKLGGGYLTMTLLVATFLGSTFVESSAQKVLSVWINYKSNITSLKEKFLINSTLNLEMFDTENTSTVFLNKTFNVSSNIIEEIARIETRASFNLNLYSLGILGFAIIELFRHYLIFKIGLSVSLNIHKKMVARALNAVMTFFDTYFVGNILNRFAQDLNVIDEHLVLVMSSFVGAIFHLGGVFGLMASVNWKFLVPAITLVVFSIVLRMLYIRTARSLKRLEAATRSPIIGHLNSTMEGLTIIRAYRAQEILKDEFDKHQDLYTSALYTSFCFRGAFAFIMETSSFLFSASVILRFLFFDSETKAGDVGLTLTQAGVLNMVINRGLTTWSEVENNMTSVERVMEYTSIENETKTGCELSDWPQKGEICFKRVFLKYANSQENILKDVSFEVRPGSKIGIVGRTGAGKSSIISTLFRLYNYEGEILVDGVNLDILSLDFLRRRISIIPQDPVMFSGTIRSNLDPLDEFTDEEIWYTLRKVQLDAGIPNLSTEISELNFSTGQRQLICLGRAIIRKNRIVVLDEATANMDPETEILAQKIIRGNFASCTVLIIAHRLDAILDCDKILVLDRGEIVEFDDPVTLLKNKSGYFAAMLNNAGIPDVNIPRIKSSV